MTTPLVSVIVPVFNTKDYLKQCLDSLIVQTLTDIEVILIDDGSTDGSSDICDKYARNDHRFKVVHKRNEGLAAARNDGVKLAQAEFIMYVDSDDWVEPNLCEKPYYTAVESEADIVCFQYYRFSETEVFKKPPFPLEGVVQKEDVLTKYWPYTYATSMNKLYRKNLFSGINYPVGRYSEDIAVAYKVIYKADKIIFLNEYLYHYRTDRADSICNSGSLKHKEDHMYFTHMMLADLKNWGLSSEDEETRFAISYLLLLGRYAELSDECGKLLMLSTDEGLSWKLKIMKRVYSISPAAFDAVAVMTGKRFREKKNRG